MERELEPWTLAFISNATKVRTGAKMAGVYPVKKNQNTKV